MAMASSAWVLQHTECIEQAVMQATGVKRVIWRTDEAMMQLEGLSKEEVSGLCGSSNETPSAGEAFIVKEEGIKFLVDPVRSFWRSLLVHDPLAPVDSSVAPDGYNLAELQMVRVCYGKHSARDLDVA